MNDKNPARILIVDDHPMMRDSLSILLSVHDDLKVCGEAADMEEALDQVNSTQPDIVLVDISLRGGHGTGIDLIKQIASRHKTAKTIALSLYDESLYGERALNAGAWGYVSKQTSQSNLVQAIRDVLHGKTYFNH